ncbi:MAG: shikimate kinase [Bacteroidota bacterium]|jgi:shikimate kinase
MRVFLIGYMGSGKSTLGPELAKALRLHFHDLDKIIEAEAWMSIKDIFRKQGEDAFRLKEQAALQKFVAGHDDFVLATGGGTPCFFDNLELMNNSGTTVYLAVEALELFRRLQHQKAERPMISRLGDAALWNRIREHLALRSSHYEQAHIIWDGKRRELSPLVELIREHLNT